MLLVAWPTTLDMCMGITQGETPMSKPSEKAMRIADDIIKLWMPEFVVQAARTIDAHTAEALSEQATFYQKQLDTLTETVKKQKRVLDEERAAKDEAYGERNKLVRLLASLYPSGIKKTDIESWDADWHWCVYINLPNGQASWHIHISEYPMFADLPPYAGEWDGHTTDEKYARIAAIANLRKE